MEESLEDDDPELTRPPFEELLLEEVSSYFVPWLDSWIACEQRGDLKVRWLYFTDIKANLSDVVRHICGALAKSNQLMTPYAEASEVSTVHVHMVQGDDEAWRREIDDSLRERLWTCCTPTVRKHLGLTP